MGQNDVFAKRNAKNHLQTILENCNKKANNKAVVIENTGHTYREHYLELAQAIIDFVRS